jgi:hypothetical protein
LPRPRAGPAEADGVSTASARNAGSALIAVATGAVLPCIGDSALAAALARSAVSIGSIPLDTGKAWAATASRGVPGSGGSPEAGDGPLNRKAGSAVVPGRG